MIKIFPRRTKKFQSSILGVMQISRGQTDLPRNRLHTIHMHLEFNYYGSVIIFLRANCNILIRTIPAHPLRGRFLRFLLFKYSAVSSKPENEINGLDRYA
ncbi:unnamed protein product [Macrosiphum euphorbiae]|uniref:Uncharacterized protein n=1 Tax=Macrosiphum euphorbiae TaxID=13131 RepID=A0AAV0X6Y2_9HEMI|nr:unnamed protein product [Macrosiphum euphorbiae]